MERRRAQLLVCSLNQYTHLITTSPPDVLLDDPHIYICTGANGPQLEKVLSSLAVPAKKGRRKR
jgi:hypothetical protein